MNAISLRQQADRRIAAAVTEGLEQLAKGWRPREVLTVLTDAAAIVADLRHQARAADEEEAEAQRAKEAADNAIQFSLDHREWTLTGSYAKANNVVLYRNNLVVDRFTVPGYKIWTYAAHLSDIVAQYEAAEVEAS